MRFVSLALAALMLGCPLAGMAQQEPPPPSRGPLAAAGNPSAVVQAEIARAHRLRDKGFAEAMADSANDDAQVIDGGLQPADAWLRHRADPHPGAARAVSAVWVSCDGSLALARGGFGDTPGRDWFVTGWVHTRKHGYRWVLDAAGRNAMPDRESDFIDGHVSDCPPRNRDMIPGLDKAARAERLRQQTGPLPVTPAPAGSKIVERRADDGTLAWRVVTGPDGHTDFTLWQWQAGAFHVTLHLDRL